MAKKITYKNEEEYNKAMEEILDLMNKGEGNLTQEEVKKLRSMAEAAQKYEDDHVPLPKPQTITGMVELKMYQLKLSQGELAVKLGIAGPKLSQILSGKRKPDVTFLKAAYKELNIDPGFLLEKA